MTFSMLTFLICLGKGRLIIMNKSFEGYPFEVVDNELKFFKGVERICSKYSAVLSSVKPIITKISLPDSVRVIESRALGGCIALKTIDFNDGLMSIGPYAFHSSISLKSIVLPSTVRTVSLGAFSNCESLESVVLSDGMITLNQQLFYQCSNLRSVTLPKYLKTLGEGVFSRCVSLNEIDLPDTVTAIRSGSFRTQNPFVIIRFLGEVFTEKEIVNLKKHCPPDIPFNSFVRSVLHKDDEVKETSLF